MADPNPMENLILIGGVPRSGTTLVQRIVASHSLVSGGPEFDLVPQIVRLRNEFHAGIENGRISAYLNHGDVDRIFRRFIESIFEKRLLQAPGKRFISEKTPANAEVFAEMSAIFPDAKLILVVRDPRAIIASMLEVGRRMKKNRVARAGFNRNVRLAVTYINQLWQAAAVAMQGNSNSHVVFYEDLVQATVPSVHALAALLGLEFEQSMIHISEYEASEFKMNEHLWYDRERLRDSILPDALDKWRSQLSAYDCYVISRRIRPIPGISDRYDLHVSGNPIYAASDFLGNALSGAIRAGVGIIARLSARAYRKC